MQYNHFDGYKTADKSAPWEKISLCDFFDKSGSQGRKMLWITLSAPWCGYCKTEAPLKEDLCAEMKNDGLSCLTAILEGDTGGVIATRGSVDWWRFPETNGGTWTVHDPIVLDPNGEYFQDFFAGNGIPGNILVDLRTMKVMVMSSGLPYGGDKARVKSWLTTEMNKVQ